MHPSRFLLCLPALALLGCGLGPTSIAEIRRNPGAFEGKTVTLRGKVTSVNQLPFLASKAYKLEGGGEEIWVTTEAAVPATDERVVVRGRVQSLAILGSSPLGLHVKESSRSKAWLP